MPSKSVLVGIIETTQAAKCQTADLEAGHPGGAGLPIARLMSERYREPFELTALARDATPNVLKRVEQIRAFFTS